MGQVYVEPHVEGLGIMLADLIRANLADDPKRLALLSSSAASVNLRVIDAGVVVGLRFTGDALHIGDRVARAHLTIECDSETLMELTNVPLRFGMPDSLTPQGRKIAGKMLNGRLKVRGLPKHLPLMIRLQRLFTVTR